MGGRKNNRLMLVSCYGRISCVLIGCFGFRFGLCVLRGLEKNQQYSASGYSAFRVIRLFRVAWLWIPDFRVSQIIIHDPLGRIRGKKTRPEAGRDNRGRVGTLWMGTF
jgi:hypothetical protein